MSKKFKKGDLVKIKKDCFKNDIWYIDSFEYNNKIIEIKLFKQHPYYKCITSSFIIVDIRDIEPYEDKEMKPYSNERNLKLSYEVKSFIEILESLNKSCKKAGGSGFDLKELERISAADLLANLSTNHIRFTIEGV